MFPLSTYRLQFHAGFTFRDAAAIVPYLHDLGISHVYASPYLKARPGSTHGYDVLDHCKLNPELGDQKDFDAFLEALAERGMSHILDIVPNHAGIATNDNIWWNDVLRCGRGSRYAPYFDITWESPLRPEMRDKILLPVLGRPYGQALEQGELKLAWEDGALFIRHYERRFPILPEGERFIASSAPSPQAALTAFNQSPELLNQLLDLQHYRLAWWRTAADEINYRRFFDINDLAALAQEKEEVFTATHRFVLELVREGKIAGLRIDHPDGLYDPKQYLQRLGASAGAAVYVVVEKILAMSESLPEDWPAAGTTGYDFLNHVNALFVDYGNADALTRIYANLTGQNTLFADLIYQKKKLILRMSLASELHTLARQLDALAQQDIHSRDFTFLSLLDALRETIACFPVYRTYVRAEGISAIDRRHIQAAVESAIQRSPTTDPSVFHFVRDTLLLEFGPRRLRPAQVQLAAKFQQLTAPTTAKGIEDTAFYIDNRLVSLNEVGGDPSVFGLPPAHLHEWLSHRQQRWPGSLSCLSTHDTKRGEDVRARLNVLSEVPQEWEEHAGRWFEIASSTCMGKPSPSLNDQYLLFQTLVGAFPIDQQIDDRFISRIQAYMQKALREAKVHTSWIQPNAGYERAMAGLVLSLLSNPEFLADFLPFQRWISHFGMLNSLSQTLLRLTAPGIPDTYQGTELFDLSLVDPDNRRRVDYDLRRRMLAELTARDRDPGLRSELLGSIADGRMKLFLSWKALVHRRESPELYTAGSYLPLQITGPRSRCAFAFLRRGGGKVALVLVPRLLARILRGDQLPVSEFWQETMLLLPSPLPGLRNLFSNELLASESQLPLSILLRDFPVALWVGGA